MASSVSSSQQGRECTLEDLSRAMSKISLKYEYIKNLRENISKKETQIDSLKGNNG